MPEIHLYQPSDHIGDGLHVERADVSRVDLTRTSDEYTRYALPPYVIDQVDVTFEALPPETATVGALGPELGLVAVRRLAVSVTADRDGLIQAVKDVFDPTTRITLDGRDLSAASRRRSCVVLIDASWPHAPTWDTPADRAFLRALEHKDVDVTYEPWPRTEAAALESLNSVADQVAHVWAEMSVIAVAHPKYEPMIRTGTLEHNVCVIAMIHTADALLSMAESAMVQVLELRSRTDDVLLADQLRRATAVTTTIRELRSLQLLGLEIPARRRAAGFGNPMTQYFQRLYESMLIPHVVGQVNVLLDRALDEATAEVDEIKTRVSTASLAVARTAALRAAASAQEVRRASIAVAAVVLGLSVVGVATAIFPAIPGVDSFQTAVAVALLATTLIAAIGAGVALAATSSGLGPEPVPGRRSRWQLAARLGAVVALVATVAFLVVSLPLPALSSLSSVAPALAGLTLVALLLAATGDFSGGRPHDDVTGER